jgi:hypothetical protein
MYRPARLHRLAESIPGLLKRLQIGALDATQRLFYVSHNLALCDQLMEAGREVFVWDGNVIEYMLE